MSARLSWAENENPLSALLGSRPANVAEKRISILK